jgi:hypothetical protein
VLAIASAGAVTAAEAPAAAPHAASAAELNAMAKRFAPVDLRADTAGLSKGDRAAIEKLIEAAKIVDTLQLRQRWAGNEALWAALQKDTTPLGKARQRLLLAEQGPVVHHRRQPFLHAGRVRGHRSRRANRRRQLLSGRRQQGSAGDLDERLPQRTRKRRSGSSP